jgi:hypothetical protein
LARRAVRLLTSNVEPASIIAFTFTKKAAGELKERIELRAAEADPQYRDLPPVGRAMFTPVPKVPDYTFVNLGPGQAFVVDIVEDEGRASPLGSPQWRLEDFPSLEEFTVAKVRPKAITRR